jgi:O-antigen/teichoic acid export membrane protein
MNSGLQRSRRLRLAAGSTAVSRGVIFVVNMLYVPLVIRHLGAASFGVWMTISTTLTMLLLLDLGVANSLTNFISEAFASGDHEHASRYMTTALTLMTSVAAGLGLAACLAWPYIDWGQLFNIQPPLVPAEVSAAVAVALVIFLVDLPARLAAKALGGYQELSTANLFATIGSLASLVVMLALVYEGVGLAGLVAGSSGPVVLADIACTFWLLCIHKTWLRPRIAHLSQHAVGRMLDLGGSLFILQIAGLLVFDSDNLIIAHYLGPAEVTPYSTAWRLASCATAVHAGFFPALWPAFSEAFARADTSWVRRLFWKIMVGTMAAAVVFAALYAICGRWVIRAWATSAAVPSQSLMLLMCAWILLGTFMNNTVIVLLAKGEIRLQAWLALGVGILNIPLSIWWVRSLGSEGAIMGTMAAYLAVLVVPQTVLAWRLVGGRTGRTIQVEG